MTIFRTLNWKGSNFFFTNDSLNLKSKKKNASQNFNITYTRRVFYIKWFLYIRKFIVLYILLLNAKDGDFLFNILRMRLFSFFF